MENMESNENTAEMEHIENPSSEAEKAKIEDKYPNIQTGFTILGPKDPKKSTKKVQQVLARWLLEPTIIPSDVNEKTKASNLKGILDKSILKQLKTNGVKYLFPVQSAVIPFLLKTNSHKHFIAPRDICVCAPTGSGKTLAFALPVIQVLKKYTVKKVRALVILPTQDLAAQVYKVFKSYTAGTNLETGLISGTNSFEIEQRQLLYNNDYYGYVSKIDILICTAGRLVKHLKSTPGIDLKSLEFLVIDEADRVLDNIQDDWLYHLEQHLHQDAANKSDFINLQTLKSRTAPQKLLFSATLSQSPEKLQKLSLFQAKLFTSVSQKIEDNQGEDQKFARPKELVEKYLMCTKEVKPLVLYTLIKKENLRKTIVFTHSIESAHRLAILLKALFKKKRCVEEISSSLKGQTRDELISKFTSGQIDVLICTDSLARGIDLPNVECVICYTSPKHLKTYIHRAGRTARAGANGLVITILHKEQLAPFKSLLSSDNSRFTMEKIDLQEGDLHAKESKYMKALTQLKSTVETEQETGLQKLKSLKKQQTRKTSLGRNKKVNNK